MNEATTEESLSLAEALDLFDRYLMGQVEFRNWLARRFPDFASVRDADVDEDIRRLAEQRQRLFGGSRDVDDSS